MKWAETSTSSSKSNLLLALFLIAIFMIPSLQLPKLTVVTKCRGFLPKQLGLLMQPFLSPSSVCTTVIKALWKYLVFLLANTTPFCFNALPLFLHATTFYFCAYFRAPYGYKSLELLPFAFSLFFQRNYILHLCGMHFSISSSWCLVMLFPQ